MKKNRITTLAMCGVMGFSAHAQNLLLNGSFESPSIPANTIQSATPTSWFWGSAAAVLFSGDGGRAGVFPLPQDGQQYADIGNE